MEEKVWAGSGKKSHGKIPPYKANAYKQYVRGPDKRHMKVGRAKLSQMGTEKPKNILDIVQNIDVRTQQVALLNSPYS